MYKLAVLPGDPNVFYSCGEDGFVQHVGLYISHAPWSFSSLAFECLFLFETEISELVFDFFRVV